MIAVSIHQCQQAGRLKTSYTVLWLSLGGFIFLVVVGFRGTWRHSLLNLTESAKRASPILPSSLKQVSGFSNASGVLRALGG